MSTFSAKKGPRESQHPAAKKALPVDSDVRELARLSRGVNVFFSAKGGKAIDDSSGFTNRFRFGKTSVVAQGGLAGAYPHPRKYPQEYPHLWNSKSPVISMTCKKYPQYPQYPRDVGDIFGCGGSYSHKETLNFTLLIYIGMGKPTPRNPKMREDFEDIEDIFRKPSNHAGLLALGFEDILRMSQEDEDTLRMSQGNGDDRHE